MAFAAFSNLRIRTKLAIAFGALALTVVGVSALSLSSLHKTNAEFEDYINGLGARSSLAAAVRTAVGERAIAARNLILVTTPEDMAIEKAAVIAAHQAVGTNLSKLESAATNGVGIKPRARELIAELVKVEQAYGKVALTIVDLALAGKKAEATKMMNEECRPLLAKYAKASDAYDIYRVGRSAELVTEAANVYAAERLELFITCLVALIAAGAAGVLVTKSITKPVAQALTVAEAVAAGDLTSKINADGKDEVSQLLRALGRMNENLGSIVSQVREGSDSIATGSKEIAAGNLDLSQRTEEQAAALEQTSATMDQLGSTVKANADNAKQANRLAQSASSAATGGHDAVEQVVHTMASITESSRKIADIISVIDGIAFQTNILALNAAVEAARAGEHGRGFAVVATEVRNLSKRSADAAKEIKALITASTEQVEAGSAQASKAGESMAEIVCSIKKVTDMVAEISAASVEQSLGVSQVGQAVSQMDQVTQQNAALVEESAAAAESLSLQAQQLVEAVAVFRLAPGNKPAEAPVVAVHAPVAALKKAPAARATAAKLVRPNVGAKAAAPRTPATAAVRRKDSVPAGEGDNWESF